MTARSTLAQDALGRSPASYVPGSAQKICQLTGELDRQLNAPTLNHTQTRYGLIGTDLGASFEHGGRLYFLFGDSPRAPRAGQPSLGPRRKGAGLGNDSIGFSTDRDPSDCLSLDFLVDPAGQFLSPTVADISLMDFEVPVGGFSDGTAMYVFFATDRGADQKDTGRLVLARSPDGGQSFESLGTVSNGTFLHVSPWTVPTTELAGLPADAGPGVLVWGSGTYRKSSPRLMFLPLTDLRERYDARYFSGLDAQGGPRWSGTESEAAELFDHPCVGELSVTHLPTFGQWLMLYQCAEPRGINFRTAPAPWGPWSPPAVLFHPRRDNGYCHFMHASWQAERCDELHGPGRENVWGGEYAPYVIAPLTIGDERTVTIYFLMSTWNPYQVMLMQAQLTREPK
ncbi:MAG: DUF4185 domain-containing protein [Chloroflexota bacterium]